MTRGNGDYPRSIKAGLPRLDRFAARWKLIPFGDLLEPVFRRVNINLDTTYQLIVAKRNRGGIVARERLRGRDIKTKDQYELREGDFVIAKRQIAHGACGLVPRELDGSIVSGEYDVFRPKTGLLPEFLDLFASTEYFQQTCFHSSVGVSIEKLVFRTDRWLRYKMPLPREVEQSKIVSVAQLFKRHIDTLKQLEAAKRAFKRGLMQQMLAGHTRCSQFRGRLWETHPFHELCEEVSERNGTQLEADDVMGVIKAVGLVQMRDRVRGKGDLTRYKIVPPDAFAYNPMRLNIGSIAHNSLGRPVLVSPDYVVFRCRKGVSLPGYINQIRYSSFWTSFMKRAGAGSVRVRIYFADLATLRVPAPKVDEQARIANTLNSVDLEVDLLVALRGQFEQYQRALLLRLLSGDLKVAV